MMTNKVLDNEKLKFFAAISVNEANNCLKGKCKKALETINLFEFDLKEYNSENFLELKGEF